MPNLKNHIIFRKTIYKERRQLNIAKRLAQFHSSNVGDSKEPLSENSMNFYLKSQSHQIYFDEISLAILQVIESEAEVITLMVDSNFRNKKLGTSLITKILANLRIKNVRKVFLEVSQKNTIALKTYSKAGFKKCGLRKNYYNKNATVPEDAVIMLRNL